MTDAFQWLLVEQHDVFTGVQAKRCGLTRGFVRSQLASGCWRQLDDGVMVASNGLPDHDAVYWAALLACGSPALISHESAAWLQGRATSAPKAVHVTIPHTRRVAAKAGVVIHRTRRPVNRARGRELPQTSVEDTVLDLAEAATRADHVVALVVTAITKRQTTLALLSEALAIRRTTPWRELLRDLFADGNGVESPLEWRYYRDVEKPHGLPASDRQHVVLSGGITERRDAKYRAQQVVVELDGQLGHEGVGAFKDMARDNAAVVRGELSLRYGWADVAGRPCAVARQLAKVLATRGWTGEFRRCPNCRQ